MFLKSEKSQNNRHLRTKFYSGSSRKNNGSQNSRHYLRSCTRWHEQGKRSNKYFLNLEKRNYSKKPVSKLKLQNGSVLTNQFDILEEQSKFYQTLYNSQKSDSADEPDDNGFFNPNNISVFVVRKRSLFL